MRTVIEFRGQTMHPPAPIHQHLHSSAETRRAWKTAALAAPEEQSCAGRAAVAVQKELGVRQHVVCPCLSEAAVPAGQAVLPAPGQGALAPTAASQLHPWRLLGFPCVLSIQSRWKKKVGPAFRAGKGVTVQVPWNKSPSMMVQPALLLLGSL